jgi:hypothetical protein
MVAGWGRSHIEQYQGSWRDNRKTALKFNIFWPIEGDARA